MSLLALIVRANCNADVGDSNLVPQSGVRRFIFNDNGHVFEGEWADGKRSGFGMQWDKDGTLLHFGRWFDDRVVESRPVPRSKIPIGAFLSAAGASCAARVARQQQSATPQR